MAKYTMKYKQRIDSYSVCYRLAFDWYLAYLHYCSEWLLLQDAYQLKCYQSLYIAIMRL